MKIYYVYKHIIEDTDEVFYIGISSKIISQKSYPRAISKQGRNIDWYSKACSKYRVEILLETKRYRTVLRIEKKLIKTYGRINLGTGTLVNKTSGGENNYKYYANNRKTKSRI